MLPALAEARQARSGANRRAWLVRGRMSGVTRTGRLIAKACDRRKGLTPEPGQTVLTVPGRLVPGDGDRRIAGWGARGRRATAVRGFLGLPCSCSSRVPQPL